MESVTLQLVDIKQFGEAIKALADGIARVADSIAHIVKLGASGYDNLRARQTQARMLELTSLMKAYFQVQARPVAELEKTLSAAPPNTDTAITYWSLLVGNRLPSLSKEVDAVIEKLQHEKSDLVLQPVYDDLLKTFHARKALFEDLKAARPPSNPEAVTILHEALLDWMRARDELRQALALLSDYLRTRSGKTT
jgi:hypothetical protein